MRRYPQGGAASQTASRPGTSHDSPQSDRRDAPPDDATGTTRPPRLTARADHDELSRLPVSEPSGVAFHPLRNSLMVVSDGGDLFELDMDFNVRQRIKLRGDLEGVGVHPTEGTVYVASESAATIYEYELQERRVLRAFRVDMFSHADFPVGGVRNKGIEGVAVAQVAANDFRLIAVVEGEPARLVHLSSDVSPRAVRSARDWARANPMEEPERVSATITQSHDLGLKRLSDVTFCPDSQVVIVISANDKVALSCDLDGHIRSTVRIPGHKPEGLCLLPDGDALVVHDTGGVYRSNTLLRDLKASQ